MILAARILFGATTVAALAQTWLGLRRGMRERNWMLGPVPIVGALVLTAIVVLVCETGVRHEQINEALAVYGMGIVARLISIVHDWRILRRAR